MSTFAKQIALELGKSPTKFDTPLSQPIYHHKNDEWQPVSKKTQQAEQKPSVTKIRLTTWNIDFQAPASNERMSTALEYLSRLHQQHAEKDAIPAVIFLQETLASDLQLIQENDWIKKCFYITDTSHGHHWEGVYGNTTLVDKRLVVERVFRVLFSASKMQRDALFVDVRLDQSEIVRLCNTHLESLTSNPPRRPVQMKHVSEYMHGSGLAPTSTSTSASNMPLPTPHAAILAGDLNAFAAEDRTLPQMCALTDAFLSLGGDDGSEEGFTWGQQVPDWLREKHGCSRMDKVLFCGGANVEKLERIGKGLKAWVEYPVESDEEEPVDEEDRGEWVWVSDHLGLQAVLGLSSS